MSEQINIHENEFNIHIYMYWIAILSTLIMFGLLYIYYNHITIVDIHTFISTILDHD
jgi:hypothetical protein